ncbi:TonB-dependent siderophore receptor [Solimonas sp. SE-A11]|uniref:TonB-dependent receptor n=1 Tax=Solimonas sp. SE-A11 TaxID=3054954 RepID=UPI00259CC6DF|nr:TonB-dependent siderophore receptor [Solimonas sp. SE-A11]MDM4771892.1 TonB-dependent siderophore receptor [Solimonas sp. SE-A11]
MTRTLSHRTPQGGFRLKPITAAILYAGGLASFGAHAQAPAAEASQQEAPAPHASDPAAASTQPEAAATLPAVPVVDFRGSRMDSTKYSRDLRDTPRLISVLPAALLEEQNALSLKDALKNVPGISLQAGEGNPPGGDQLKIRGYNARDDINVNDTRDLGNYFRDPFYIDQLEVVKGPNSAYAGRGSAGGTINFVTKKPHQTDANRFEGSIGTDNLYRATLDMNKTLGDNSAMRVNLLAHDADIPGRDVVDESRYGLYAAYSWGFKGPTRFSADFLHLRQDDLPDAGLPADRGNLLGQGGVIPAGLDYDNFYGHTNDRKEVNVNQLGLAIQHALGSNLVIKNQLRLSRVDNDGWASSPRISTAANPGGLNPDNLSCSVADPCVRGETKPRDQVDEGLNNQTDLLLDFKTGAIEHNLVAGVEVARYSYENDRRRDTRGPWTRLADPTRRAMPAHQNIGGTLFGLPVHDGTTYRLQTEEVGVYLLDTVALAPQWDLNLGARWDQVDAKATRRGFDGVNAPTTNNTTHERDDDEISYNLGLVYKLTPNASLYAAYGNAYVMSANFDRNSVQLAGGGAAEPIVGAGFDTPPEKIKAYELGAKWTVGAGLDLGAAIFRTETSEGRFPGQDPANITTPNVEYYIEGVEIIAAGKITDKWRLYSGYTYLKSKIEDAPPTSPALDRDFVLGQELGGTPRHSFNLFSTYDVTARITLGGGIQYMDEVTSGVDPLPNAGNVTVRADDYTVVDFYGTYKFTGNTQFRLNLLNAFDERYISQLAEGGGQATPGRGRQAVVTLRHDF